MFVKEMDQKQLFWMLGYIIMLIITLVPFSIIQVKLTRKQYQVAMGMQGPPHAIGTGDLIECLMDARLSYCWIRPIN